MRVPSATANPPAPTASPCAQTPVQLFAQTFGDTLVALTQGQHGDRDQEVVVVESTVRPGDPGNKTTWTPAMIEALVKEVYKETSSKTFNCSRVDQTQALKMAAAVNETNPRRPIGPDACRKIYPYARIARSCPWHPQVS